GRPPVYWWDQDIAQVRRECLKARRLHQRARNGPRYEELTAAYESKRKELKVAIRKAKRRCWQSFCEEVDRDPWGRPYKAVMHRIKPRGKVPPSCPLLLDKIVRHLFPKHGLRAAGTGLKPMAADGTAEPPEVTETELRGAASRISVRKAPGPDGIPGLAIKTAAVSASALFCGVFGACFAE
ncbi:hypothetical protein KM043_000026, partial [Ampulex compressa]